MDKKAALIKSLKKRYATLIEVDLNTDGLFEDAAQVFGVEDVSDLTVEDGMLIGELVNSFADWMRAYPGVRS